MTPAVAFATRDDLDVEVPRRTRHLRAVRGASVLLLLVAIAVRSLWSRGATGDVDAAAAWAGSVSWKAWWLGSLDPAAATSLGSPAAHWATALAVRLAGSSGPVLALPTVPMAVVAVAVLTAVVGRIAGRITGLAAGALLTVLLPTTTAQVQLALLGVLAATVLLRARRRPAGLPAGLLAGMPAGLAWLTGAVGGTVLVVLLVALCLATGRRWTAVSVTSSATVVVGAWWFTAEWVGGPVVVTRGGFAGVVAPVVVVVAVLAGRAVGRRGGRAVVALLLVAGLLAGSVPTVRSAPAAQGAVDASVAELLAGAGTTWSAAAVGVQASAALELASGTSVLPVGGADGLTLAGFQSYVATGRVRYLVVTTPGTAADVVSWVSRERMATGVGGTVVYDLAGS